VTTHPDDAALRAFVRHALAADRTLAVDDHLAACEQCRARAAALGDASAALIALSLDLEAATREAAAPVAGAWRAPSGRWLTAAAAVAVVAFASIAGWRWWAMPPEPAPSIAGIDRLSAERRARLQAALDSGVADLPPPLESLRQDREVLLGADTAPVFRVMTPLTTVTVSDRPEFRWQPMSGATAYTVAVFDVRLQAVAGPATVVETRWTPPQALPRDREYLWQVTATVGATAVTAPSPPQPLARFRVMEATAAAELAAAAGAAPGAHLVLGLALAQAGARQEALEHLRLVPDTDPHAPVARRTARALEALVGSR
jgi:hypothetical protein